MMLAAFIKKKKKKKSKKETWQAVTFLHKCGCFSAWPLISKVYFGRPIGPRGPFTPVSFYLHLTNCTLSHNTLSAFNYCLEVSRSRVTHSTGSLCVRVCAVWPCAWLSPPGAPHVLCRTARGVEGCAEFLFTFSSRSSRTAHPSPAPPESTSGPRTCFRSANGLPRATGTPGERDGAAITGV